MTDIDCWDCGKRFNTKNHLEADYGDFKVYRCPQCDRMLIKPSTKFGERVLGDIRGEAIVNVSYLIDRYYKELKERGE
jgi:NAD-dependent SIR2 family protein deacetylase